MSEEILTLGGITICVLLIIYSIFGLIIEKTKPICGHEASLIVIVGMIVSYIAYAMGEEDAIEMMTFDSNFFFYFCLPPIVFNSAFNMRRKVFFENFDAVMIFGVLSTIIQFFLFTLGTFYAQNMFVMHKTTDG